LITTIGTAFSSVNEIIHSGEIQSTAEGESVCIELRGNICGDILVFVGPKIKATAGQGIMDLITSDTKLDEQAKDVFKTFSMKMKAISALPNSLIWLINIVLSGIILNRYAEPILTSFRSNDPKTGILQLLPVIVLTTVTVLFGRKLGLKLIEPLFATITRIIRFWRRIRNRKVSE